MDVSNLFLFGPYALLGLFISQWGDVYSSGIKLSEFNAKKWVDDNFIQLVFSLFCITALLLVGDLFEVATGTKLNGNTVFWAGLGADAIINFFMRRKKNTKE